MSRFCFFVISKEHIYAQLFVLFAIVESGKKTKAVELYKMKKVSLGLGAKLAGVSLSEFIDLLKEHNVYLNNRIPPICDWWLSGILCAQEPPLNWWNSEHQEPLTAIIA